MKTCPPLTPDERQKLQRSPLAVLDLFLENVEIADQEKAQVREYILNKHIIDLLRGFLQHFLTQHNHNRSQYKNPDDYGKLLAELWLSIKTDFPSLIAQHKADLRSPLDKLTEIGDILSKKLPPYHAREFRDKLRHLIYEYTRYVEEWLKGMLSNKIKGIFRDSYDIHRKNEERIAPASRLVNELLIAALKHTNEYTHWEPYQLAPLIKPVAPVKPTATPAPTPPIISPKPTAKSFPVYLLIDSSRHVSDSTAFLDAGITLLNNHLRARPPRSVPCLLGLIPINDVSDLTAPLSGPAAFYASGLVGAGNCQFGRALLSLNADIAGRLSDSKPLVVIFLAGAPDDAWQKPAQQLQDWAVNGKLNVIAIGAGPAASLDALKQVGATQPLHISALAQREIEQTFDWLFGVIDVILSGLEGGASGKLSVPKPPPCLQVLP